MTTSQEGKILILCCILFRFIIGEITTAIQAVHEQGFCYNDLKPENILITELGHVKV